MIFKGRLFFEDQRQLCYCRLTWLKRFSIASTLLEAKNLTKEGKKLEGVQLPLRSKVVQSQFWLRTIGAKLYAKNEWHCNTVPTTQSENIPCKILDTRKTTPVPLS